VSRPTETPATVWTDLQGLVASLTRAFSLEAEPILEAFDRRRRRKSDGDCLRTVGTTPIVRVRVHRFHRPRQALSRSTIFAAFAHEMAHLAPGCWRHGERHDAKTREIAVWILARGYPVSRSLKHGSHPFAYKRRKKR